MDFLYFVTLFYCYFEFVAESIVNEDGKYFVTVYISDVNPLPGLIIRYYFLAEVLGSMLLFLGRLVILGFPVCHFTLVLLF